jgi:hypothetical protein
MRMQRGGNREARTEPYIWYGEGVLQRLTPRCAAKDGKLRALPEIAIMVHVFGNKRKEEDIKNLSRSYKVKVRVL